MKRSLQQQQSESSMEQLHPQQQHQHQQGSIVNTNFPLNYDLGSCLKRVRISMSPGELRLDRDLSELGNHWRQVDDRVYVWEECYSRLERTNDPLRLVLRIQHVELKIAVHRLYPHAPPVVTRTLDVLDDSNHRHHHHPHQRIVVSLASQYQYQYQYQSTLEDEDEMEDEQTTVTANTNADRDGGTLVYDNWSPIQQIGHLVDFLVKAFGQYHHDGSGTNFSSNATIVSEDHEEEDDEDAMQITSPVKTVLPLDSFLPPNRFDLGYDRQRRSTLMEC